MRPDLPGDKIAVPHPKGMPTEERDVCHGREQP